MNHNLLIYFLLSIIIFTCASPLIEKTNLMEQGKTQFKEKKYSLSKESFSKLIEKEPQNLEAYQLRAFSSYGLGEFNSCIKDYDYILTKSQEGKYFKFRGLCYSQIGKNKKAKEDLKTAMKKGLSNDGLVLTYYCDILDRLGDKNSYSYCVLAKNTKEKISELNSIIKRIKYRETCEKSENKPIRMEFTEENMILLMDSIKTSIESKNTSELQKNLPCILEYSNRDKIKYITRAEAIPILYRDLDSILWETQERDNVSSWIFNRKDEGHVRFGLKEYDDLVEIIYWQRYEIY